MDSMMQAQEWDLNALGAGIAIIAHTAYLVSPIRHLVKDREIPNESSHNRGLHRCRRFPPAFDLCL